MPTEVTLPRPVQDTLDEVARIKKKIEELGKIGAPDALIAALNGALAEALNVVNEHLGTEADKEIGRLPGMAEDVAKGLVPDGAVELNDDIKRLQGVNDEKKKIAEKLKVARKHRDGLDDENEIKGVEEDVKDLDDAIRKAAIEAAKRELEELKKEIDNIKNGKPKKGDGKGPADPPPPPKDKDKSGGGTSGGSTDDDDKKEDGGAKKDEIKAPKVHTIYVRDGTRVWAWNARTMGWIEMEFAAPLVDVKLIKGGILAFSAEKAAIYDSYVGVWLNALNLPNGDLSEGDAKTDN